MKGKKDYEKRKKRKKALENWKRKETNMRDLSDEIMSPRIFILPVSNSTNVNQSTTGDKLCAVQSRQIYQHLIAI